MGYISDLNWVERLAAQREALSTKPQEMWNELRAAVQDACESFNKRFHPDSVVCQLENGKRIRIGRGERTVIVYFDLEHRRINVARESHTDSFEFGVNEYAQVHLQNKNKAVLTADQFSMAVLQPLLFPELG